MDTPEIVQGLRAIQEMRRFSRKGEREVALLPDERRTLDAAIARLSVTCETCDWWQQQVFKFGFCAHRRSYWRGDEFCNQHAPRVPAREGGE